MNNIILFEIEVGLFTGNPVQGGIEISSENYHRADFGEVGVAGYGAVWGIINKASIIFPRSTEEWIVSHVGIYAKDYETMIAVAPIADVSLYFDSTVTSLKGTETKVIPANHQVILQPAKLFLLGNLVGDALDFDGQSKMIN